MAPRDAKELFALLKQSQLLSSRLLRRLEPQVTKLHRSGLPARRLAASLVKSNVITGWQARRLLSGKSHGFYIAKFKLLELLGYGGMGRVYLAEQVTMQRMVAIKIVHNPAKADPDSRREVLARFAREARAVAALRHPNIIHAYDFDEEDDVPYIVLEYVEGIDTARQVRKFGRVPWRQAADYIAQAAAGLHQAHEAGLVHRDVKPGNLLVGTDGQLKLLDLGLVACFDDGRQDRLTMCEEHLGTVDYIAPEQAIDSHNVDRRADLYSLGATAYYLLSGQVLFPGKSPTKKLLAHHAVDPTPIRELVPEMPEEFADIVGRMLAKDRDDRFQTADDVRKRVEPFAERLDPPFDLVAVRFSRDVFEAFLNRGPDVSQLSIGSPAMAGIMRDLGNSLAGDGEATVSESSSTADIPSFMTESAAHLVNTSDVPTGATPSAGFAALIARCRPVIRPLSGLPRPLLVGVGTALAVVLIGALVLIPGETIEGTTSIANELDGSLRDAPVVPQEPSTTPGAATQRDNGRQQNAAPSAQMRSSSESPVRMSASASSSVRTTIAFDEVSPGDLVRDKRFDVFAGAFQIVDGEGIGYGRALSFSPDKKLAIARCRQPWIIENGQSLRVACDFRLRTDAPAMDARVPFRLVIDEPLDRESRVSISLERTPSGDFQLVTENLTGTASPVGAAALGLPSAISSQSDWLRLEVRLGQPAHDSRTRGTVSLSTLGVDGRSAPTQLRQMSVRGSVRTTASSSSTSSADGYVKYRVGISSGEMQQAGVSQVLVDQLVISTDDSLSLETPLIQATFDSQATAADSPYEITERAGGVCHIATDGTLQLVAPQEVSVARISWPITVVETGRPFRLEFDWQAVNDAASGTLCLIGEGQDAAECLTISSNTRRIHYSNRTMPTSQSIDRSFEIANWYRFVVTGRSAKSETYRIQVIDRGPGNKTNGALWFDTSLSEHSEPTLGGHNFTAFEISVTSDGTAPSEFQFDNVRFSLVE